MTCAVDTDPVASLDEVLSKFLADPSSASEFPVLAQPHLVRFSRRFGAGLPDDVRDEIVNETLIGVMNTPTATFDPARGSALTFLAYQARQAARRVRAQYAPPAEKKRVPRKARAKVDLPEPTVVPKKTAVVLEELPAAAYGANLQFETLLASEVLAAAPLRVRTALIGIHYEGHSLRNVAAAVGVNHGVLSRELSAFAATMRAAA